jgi:CheY-like chemotaxis protein
MIAREKFAIQAKDALAHLYDYVHLQNHPLAEHLAIEGTPDATTKAKRLRQTIVEAMEELKPELSIPFDSKEWRGYRILYQRFIEGMRPEEVMEELALSSSHFYREQRKALEAVASLLWDKKPETEREEGDGAEPQMGSHMLQAEVERMAACSTKEGLALGEVIQEVLTLVQGLATQKQVSLRLDLAEALPSVHTGHSVLRQILLNALCQALEWTQRGVITMSVAERGNQVAVEAFMEGLDAERWEGKEETSGLAVARWLAESQGGGVEVGLEKRIITIFLPTASRTTVLVVDDNEDAVRLLERYLNGHAYQVVGARSCEEALRLACDLKPQIITLDVMMPDRDGWEALQALKNHPATCHIPILVCSVLDEPELTFSLGAEEHLTKPISQERLLAALERCRRELVEVEGSPG